LKLKNEGKLNDTNVDLDKVVQIDGVKYTLYNNALYDFDTKTKITADMFNRLGKYGALKDQDMELLQHLR
jgi:hypothetical protein